MFRLIRDCVPACHDLTGLSERASTKSQICIYRRTNSEGLALPAVCGRIAPNRRLYSMTVTGRLKYPTHVSSLSLAFPCKPRSSLLIFTPGRARLELPRRNPVAESQVKRTESPLFPDKLKILMRVSCSRAKVLFPSDWHPAPIHPALGMLQLRTHVRAPRLFFLFAKSRMAH